MQNKQKFAVSQLPQIQFEIVQHQLNGKIKFIGINNDSLFILVQKKSTVVSVNSSLYRFAIEKIKRISEKLSDINKPISANLLAVYSLKPTAINNNSRIGF